MRSGEFEADMAWLQWPGLQNLTLSCLASRRAFQPQQCFTVTVPSPDERLCHAAANGDVDLMRAAVADGANVREARAQRLTTRAIQRRKNRMDPNSREEILEMTDFFRIDLKSHALWCALHGIDPRRAVAALVEMEPDIVAEEESTMLHGVVQEYRLELMMLLLRAGARLPPGDGGYYLSKLLNRWTFADEYLNCVCLAGSFEAYKEGQYRRVATIYLLAREKGLPDELTRPLVKPYLDSLRRQAKPTGAPPPGPDLPGPCRGGLIHASFGGTLVVVAGGLRFKVNWYMRLQKLFEAYAARQGVPLDSVSFLFKGKRLRGDETFSGIGMVDGDELFVYNAY